MVDQKKELEYQQGKIDDLLLDAFEQVQILPLVHFPKVVLYVKENHQTTGLGSVGELIPSCIFTTALSLILKIISCNVSLN